MMDYQNETESGFEYFFFSNCLSRLKRNRKEIQKMGKTPSFFFLVFPNIVLLEPSQMRKATLCNGFLNHFRNRREKVVQTDKQAHRHFRINNSRDYILRRQIIKEKLFR